MGKIWDADTGGISDATLATRMQAAGLAPTSSPTFTTPNIGAATGTSLTLTGAQNAASQGITGANGQVLAIKVLEELTTIAAAASSSTTIQLPAGAVILAVTVRVTTAIPSTGGVTGFTVGDAGSAARYNTATVSITAGSTDAGTKAGAYYNASATAVVLTPNASPAANTGRVRTTIFYYQVTPPTA